VHHHQGDERQSKGELMKTRSTIRSGLLLFAGMGIVVLTALALSVFQVPAVAAQKSSQSLAADQASFLSDTARLQRDPGTPVGPPTRIIICHNGHTIRVSESAVPAHLAHGDTLGPCPDDVVVCRNGHTIVISQTAVSPGDTLGPCSNQVFMCNLHLHIIVVNPDAISDHLARGHALGLCPGKNLVCHKGHTIVVADSAVPAHLAHGDSLGYCLGAQGPLITDLPPPTASQ
jgi:hypothetical protein